MTALITEDFELNQTQLDLINDYMREQNSLFTAEGKPSQISITFKFTGEDRVIEIKFNETDSGVVLS